MEYTIILIGSLIVYSLLFVIIVIIAKAILGTGAIIKKLKAQDELLASIANKTVVGVNKTSGN